MATVSIRLSKTAADKVRSPDIRQQLERDAALAFSQAGAGDIYCLAFRSGGRQFALSSRIVLDVEWLPNRLPPQALRGAPPLPRQRGRAAQAKAAPPGRR